MIYVVETRFKGIVHAQFNAALIALVSLAFPQKTVVFMAHDSHLKAVKKILVSNDILGVRLVKIDFQIVGLRGIRKYLCLGRFIARLFKGTRGNNCKLIIFSSVTYNFEILVLKLIQLFNGSITCLSIFHDGLEEGLSQSARYSIKGAYFKLALLFPARSNVIYIVLGESIVRELQSRIPRIGKRVLPLNHPFFSPKKTDRKEKFGERPVLFGFVGFLKNWKCGLDRFVDILEVVSRKCTNQAASFVYIGSGMSKEVYRQCLGFNNIKVPSPYVPLSYEDYNNYIDNTDYIIYLANEGSYHLRASGSFLDAMAHLKPIIAIRNPFFSYYFDKYGDIGYLCKDFDEVSRIVLEIIENHPVRHYRLQQDNIRRFLRETSLANQSEQLRSLVQ